MPSVVGSVTTPSVESTAKSVLTTVSSRSPVSESSSVKPNTAATACMSSSTAGISASQKVLFLSLTFQFIIRYFPPFILYSMVQICCLVAGESGFSPSDIPFWMTHLRASSASLDGSGVGVGVTFKPFSPFSRSTTG